MDMGQQMRTWQDVITFSDIEDDIEDAKTIKNKSIKKHEHQLSEAPLQSDIFDDDENSIHPVDRRNQADEYMRSRAANLFGDQPNDRPDLINIGNYTNYSVYANKKWTEVVAFDKNGKAIGLIQGRPLVGGKVFEIEVTNADQNVKGVMFNMFMDILRTQRRILSGKVHSDAARRFWEKIIEIPHLKVYVTIDGEIIERATPLKFDKYWTKDDKDPNFRNHLQFLLVP